MPAVRGGEIAIKYKVLTGGKKKEMTDIYPYNIPGYTDEVVEYWVQNAPSPRNYAIYKIPKPNGEYRIIEEPCPDLKQLQRALLPLLDQVPRYSRVYGVKGTSAVGNAGFHFTTRPKVIIKMDIKRFFPSTTRENFERRLTDQLPVPTSPLLRLAPIFFVDNGGRYRLPTGAPTSPLVASIAFTGIDMQLVYYCLHFFGLSYSRYVDDLCFSGHYYPDGFQKDVTRIVEAGGYKINHKKSEVIYNTRAQEITGTLINSSTKRLRTTREYRRNLRAALDQAARLKEVDVSLQGRIAYLKQVDPPTHTSMMEYYNRRIDRWASEPTGEP